MKNQRSDREPSRSDITKPCAFYHAAMPVSQPGTRSAAQTDSGAQASGLSHRCILNPGRGCGPDGADIGPILCTVARQSECQRHRRSRLDRLHATLSNAVLASSARASLAATAEDAAA